MELKPLFVLTRKDMQTERASILKFFYQIMIPWHNLPKVLLVFHSDVSELDELGELRVTIQASRSSRTPEPPRKKQHKVEVDHAVGEIDDLATMNHLHDLWQSLADRENDPLPHHISTPGERADLLDGLVTVLDRLHNPCLIMVARSVADGYTPREQVAEIQLEFFRLLCRVYGECMLTVELDYDGAEADAQALQSLGLEVTITRGRENQLPRHEHCGPSGDSASEPGTKDFAQIL
uniref:NOG1 domain-containing protein n=1 Tax=Mesocestoides corti TaxID=53468 RepID=A0A5K3FVD4_MESCO